MKNLFCLPPAKNRKDRILQLVLFGGCAVLLTGLVYLLGYRCPSRWVFGVECPACGMTRAAILLLKWDFIGAFMQNPLVYVVIVYLVFFAAMWLKGSPERFFSKKAGWIFCSIFLAFWVVKLFLFLRGDYPDFLQADAYLPSLWRGIRSLFEQVYGSISMRG